MNVYEFKEERVEARGWRFSAEKPVFRTISTNRIRVFGVAVSG